MNDLISRQAAIDVIDSYEVDAPDYMQGWAVKLIEAIKEDIRGLISELLSARPEPLTDKEQRIFLAAMDREKKVCKEVDAEMTREPYEDSLVRTCHEIIRKVKGALWTI
jgi:hypothetical protein